MHTPNKNTQRFQAALSSQTFLIYSLLIAICLASSVHGAPVAYKRSDRLLSDPVTVTTVSETQTTFGTFAETCKITLIPFITNGQPLVKEVKECSFAKVNLAQSSQSKGPSRTTTQASTSTTASTGGVTSSSKSSSKSASKTRTSSSRRPKATGDPGIDDSDFNDDDLDGLLKDLDTTSTKSSSSAKATKTASFDDSNGDDDEFGLSDIASSTRSSPSITSAQTGSASATSTMSSGTVSSSAQPLATAAPPIRTNGLSTVPRPTPTGSATSSSAQPSATGAASSVSASASMSSASSLASSKSASSSAASSSATSSVFASQSASPSASLSSSASATVTSSAIPSGLKSALAASPTGTAEAAASPSAKSNFVLPGQTMPVLPIGLGIFAGITVIALVVVGLVTYERTKYRKAFRAAKKAEAGSGA